MSWNEAGNEVVGDGRSQELTFLETGTRDTAEDSPISYSTYKRYISFDLENRDWLRLQAQQGRETGYSS